MFSEHVRPRSKSYSKAPPPASPAAGRTVGQTHYTLSGVSADALDIWERPSLRRATSLAITTPSVVYTKAHYAPCVFKSLTNDRCVPFCFCRGFVYCTYVYVCVFAGGEIEQLPRGPTTHSVFGVASPPVMMSIAVVF